MGAARANFPTDVAMANDELTVGRWWHSSHECRQVGTSFQKELIEVYISISIHPLDLKQILKTKVCAAVGRCRTLALWYLQS